MIRLNCVMRKIFTYLKQQKKSQFSHTTATEELISCEGRSTDFSTAGSGAADIA